MQHKKTDKEGRASAKKEREEAEERNAHTHTHTHTHTHKGEERGEAVRKKDGK
jgi:hypothetical protein